MLRPRDRRMDTLGLGWGQVMNSISRCGSKLFTWLDRRIWLPASRCCPWWRSASARQRRCSQSLASDQPLRRFAGPATFVPAFSTKWVLSETGKCITTKIFTWTSITLMSIKAVTEIPIMAPPFKTRTATWYYGCGETYLGFQKLSRTFMMVVAVKSESAIFSIIQAPT